MSRFGAHGDAFLAGHAEFRPRHGVQPLGGDRLFAFVTDAVGALFDAPQGVLNFAQELDIQGIPVQENPLFVALLAEIALVVRMLFAGQHLSGFLGGHAAAHFLRLFL